MIEVRCSGLARVMACPGFLYFKNLPTPETNSAAEEGTACGEYLAKKLTSKDEVRPGMVASNGVHFTDDMDFYTLPLRNDIYSRRKGEIRCEQRVDWVTRSGIHIRGSYDIAYVGTDDSLYIDDLKYGYGIVDVRENWQLLGYAIGEVIRRQIAFPKIVLRILQPRPHHEDGPIREWCLTYGELLEYKEMIEKRMDEVVAQVAMLNTNEKCKYCNAAAMCPALNRAFNASIDVSTAFLQDNIDEKEIARQLDQATRAADLIKTRQESLKQLAMDRMKRGGLIPGYVVEPSYGDRKWKSQVMPESIEIMTSRKVTERVMLSPAKCEKLGIPKFVIDKFVDRHFLGNKLVKKDTESIGDKIFGKPEGVN